MAEVRAEKVRKWLMYSSGRFLRSLSEMVRVFPVPVGPMHSTWESRGHAGRALSQGPAHSRSCHPVTVGGQPAPDLGLGVG